jgi:hypothetical protein
MKAPPCGRTDRESEKLAPKAKLTTAPAWLRTGVKAEWLSRGMPVASVVIRVATESLERSSYSFSDP